MRIDDNNLVYQFRSLEPRLTDAYRTLIEGLKIEATDHFAKLAAVVEIALELLDRLKGLQARANELVKHIEAKNKPNIKSGITEVESALDAAVKIAQSAVEHITDIIRKQVLRGAIEDLKRVRTLDWHYRSIWHFSNIMVDVRPLLILLPPPRLL